MSGFTLAGKILGIIITTVIICALGVVTILYLGSRGGIQQAQLSEDQSVVNYKTYDADNTADLWKPDKQAGAETYLLVGSDSRQGENSGVGAGGSEITGTRSDTIMLAHVPATQDGITVISIPRDLSVTKENCESWDPSDGSYGNIMDTESDVKINSTFSTGGPRCLASTLTKITGLKITRYASVDFSGFEELVNTVGGVTVTSDHPLNDEILGHVMDAGEHTLNGKQALNYVRARHITGESKSDYDRMNRQQNFLHSFLSQAINSNTLTDPVMVTKLVKGFIRHSTVDNITESDMMNMAKMVNHIGIKSITFDTLPTLGSNDNWNEIPDPDGIEDLLNSTISAGERETTPRTTTTSTVPSTTTETTDPEEEDN